jgi:hypothetical protein
MACCDGTVLTSPNYETLRQLAAQVDRMPVEHDWETCGWEPFQRKIVNQDGAQAFALSVNGGYGRVTGTGAGGGNQRELLVHECWSATDGEITAVFKGPSTYVPSPLNRPQMGVVLRQQEIAGFHVAFVVWYDVFVGDPRILNISGWRGNGGATLNQAAGGQYTAEISRDLRIIAAQRFEFLGSWINELTCIPSHLHGLAIGNSVTVDCDDNTFDATAVALGNADRERATLQYAEPDTLSGVTNKVANGTVVLASAHERYWPYVVKARLVGNTISVKAWRGRYDAEPGDWQSVVTVATDADFPALPAGPGLFGVVAAHAHDGSFVQYGQLTFRKLA